MPTCEQEQQSDKDNVDRARAGITQAREEAAEEATAKEEEARTEKEKEKEKRVRIAAMLEESEGVARNIAKAEKAIQEEKEERCGKEEKEEAGGRIEYDETVVEALEWVFP